MKKRILLIGLLIVAGCSSEVARWEDAGTLISVGPAEEPTRPSGRLGTALGENEWGRTRVETTEGTFIVYEKINVSQVGMPVKIGYDKHGSLDDIQGQPSYLSLGGQKYRIAR